MVTEADKVTRFILGNTTGVVADRIRKKLTETTETQAMIGTGFKHYHGSILMYAAHEFTGSPFMHGLSTSFLILEMSKEDPFGLNDPPEVQGLSYAFTVGLLGLLAVVESVTRFGSNP